MYIKSTNEYISSPAHVWDSIEKHLGYEYTEEVRKILDTIPKGYITDKEVEQMENSYRQELDSYESDLGNKDSAFSDIQELCDNLIDYINEQNRLSRTDIKKRIEEIKNIAYHAY